LSEANKILLPLDGNGAENIASLCYPQNIAVYCGKLLITGPWLTSEQP